MKLFVISDIHGSLYFLRKVINIFDIKRKKKNMIKYLFLEMNFIMGLEILCQEIILLRK